MIQSTGSSGIAIINGLANATTVSSSTNTQVFIPVIIGAGQTETLNLPDIHEKVKEFYNKYYSSDLMTLLVYTNQDILITKSEIEKLVVRVYFY
jgi:hypothetical protein